jgi:hypothetical protein
VCLFTQTAFAQGTRMEIIELRNREAAELIPIVKPMLGAQTSLAADGYRLIVKGTPSDIAQLESLVATLDERLRNLLIDVRTVQRTALDNSSASAEITIGDESSVRIDASRTSTRARDTNSFQVRTIEGRAALVQVGEQRPAQPGVISIVGGHVVTFGGHDERSALSGVYVTARVRGEQVMLDIAPDLQSFSGDGTRRTQSANTTLTGALGRWITIAAVDTVGSGEAHGAAGRQIRSGTQGFVTQVKVTLLE